MAQSAGAPFKTNSIIENAVDRGNQGHDWRMGLMGYPASASRKCFYSSNVWKESFSIKA